MDDGTTGVDSEVIQGHIEATHSHEDDLAAINCIFDHQSIQFHADVTR